MIGIISTGTFTLPSGGHIYFNNSVSGLTLQIAGVDVGEGVNVKVGVMEGVNVCVAVDVEVGVLVLVDVGV